MTDSTQTGDYRLVVINGGTSDPSSTRMLADRIADAVAKAAKTKDARVRITTIDLRDLATEITTGIVTGLQGPGLEAASAALGAADGIIAASPVYKSETSGLFNSFMHVLDRDLLIGKPVVLAATAGTARHALVVDGQMRSLFAYLRTLTTPTAIFASTEDWNDSALSKRIERAALELWLLMEMRFADRLREASWSSYQHDFGSAGGTELGINLDSDLMRLATGGSLK
ncbi:NADH-dependent FMN reductase [Gulosibacter macacae]|uniref:NADH-dependent FMN reductase n=1 Tax=Gulosibacter macacae TaxID=2488791 RepID=A0A3P3VUD6_9MICO|nr:CE1759 family FMN reductase [Gulosibacter macacae]RRJ85598.1 NADH-dependent FMN reductase [Gulosibacter macacae]